MFLELLVGGLLFGGGSTRTVERTKYYPVTPPKTAAELKSEAEERQRHAENDRKLEEKYRASILAHTHDFTDPYTMSCRRCGCDQGMHKALRGMEEWPLGIMCVPQLGAAKR